MIKFVEPIINKDTKFSYSGYFILRKDDLHSLIRIIIRNKISMIVDESRIIIGQNNNLESIKNNVVNYVNNFTTITVYYVESEKREISSVLEKNGFRFNFLGDDGSWAAKPYYLVTSPKSLNEIKDLVQKGYFKNLTNNLWRIG